MDLQMQLKLLKMLEGMRFRRLGDVRLHAFQALESADGSREVRGIRPLGATGLDPPRALQVGEEGI
jgi:hypothetical protein